MVKFMKESQEVFLMEFQRKESQVVIPYVIPEGILGPDGYSEEISGKEIPGKIPEVIPGGFFVEIPGGVPEEIPGGSPGSYS